MNNFSYLAKILFNIFKGQHNYDPYMIKLACRLGRLQAHMHRIGCEASPDGPLR